jgi:hypothetical protein
VAAISGSATRGIASKPTACVPRFTRLMIQGYSRPETLTMC